MIAIQIIASVRFNSLLIFTDIYWYQGERRQQWRTLAKKSTKSSSNRSCNLNLFHSVSSHDKVEWVNYETRMTLSLQFILCHIYNTSFARNQCNVATVFFRGLRGIKKKRYCFLLQFITIWFLLFKQYTVFKGVEELKRDRKIHFLNVFVPFSSLIVASWESMIITQNLSNKSWVKSGF